MIGIGEGLVFAIMSVVIILFSLATVLARDIVRAALGLIFAMFTVAAIYITLNAQFLGIAQILVYVGAVGVLILFAVMLTKRDAGDDE